MAKHSDQEIVGISAPAVVRTIAEIHNRLLQALQCGGNVRLDLSAAVETDLTFVQLVESARRFAAAEGKSIALSAPVSEGLQETLQRGGFLGAAKDRQFWLHETGEC
jgi:hypothetical protein